jgi:hypothetical protein
MLLITSCTMSLMMSRANSWGWTYEFVSGTSFVLVIIDSIMCRRGSHLRFSKYSNTVTELDFESYALNVHNCLVHLVLDESSQRRFIFHAIALLICSSVHHRAVMHHASYIMASSESEHPNPNF